MICQGHGQIPSLQFKKKNGSCGGIHVLQTHFVKYVRLILSAANAFDLENSKIVWSDIALFK